MQPRTRCVSIRVWANYLIGLGNFVVIIGLDLLCYTDSRADNCELKNI